jgi:hypothetical protein
MRGIGCPRLLAENANLLRAAEHLEHVVVKPISFELAFRIDDKRLTHRFAGFGCVTIADMATNTAAPMSMYRMVLLCV